MYQHAQHMLGVEIVFMLGQPQRVLESTELLDTPPVEGGRCTSLPTTSMLPAMLLPREAECYAIYADAVGGLFVRTQDHGGLFMLQERWRQLGNVLPKDSTCRAIVYRDKSGRLVFGVYDLLRLAGVEQTNSSIFERQKMLFGLFSNASAGPDIVLHWVGQEGSLREHLQKGAFCNSLSFDMDYMLRIDRKEGKEVYRRVLRPLMLSALE